MRSHIAQVTVAAALALPCGFLLHAGEAAEDQLKSATLLAFLQNIDWTGEVAANVPLTVGVLGRASLARCLRESIEGKTAGGHPLQIVDLHSPIDPHCCQLLYFATDKVPEIKPILQGLGSSHVLTVGETTHFLEQGGAINLFLVDGHMAFEVSRAALDHAGISISSRLLRFGQIRDPVKGRPGN